MPDAAIAHLSVHQQLSTWVDELEFLGYILVEIIDPNGFEASGFTCHQAADLPAIVNILRLASKREGSRLYAISTDDELRRLRNLMRKSKQIRNAMAHHLLPDEGKMSTLQTVKEEVCAILESLIRSAAAEFEISQIGWYPYSHNRDVSIEEASSKATVYLGNGPLLSFRQLVLSNNTRSQVMGPRRKHKATEQTRREHWQAFEAAQIRRKEKQKQHFERIQKQKIDKERKKKEKSDQIRFVRMAQLRQIMDKMQADNDLFRGGNMHDLHEETPFSDLCGIFILMLLGISSPFWIVGLCVQKLCTMCSTIEAKHETASAE